VKKWVLLLSLTSPLFAQYSTTSCNFGETGTCRLVASCNSTDINTTIAASSNGGLGYIAPNHFDGDGVYVPAGSCSWTSPVNWTNKNINLIGNGGILPSNATKGNLTSSNTVITHNTSNAFQVNASNNGFTAATFRIAGFTFSGSNPSNQLLNINNSNPNMTAENGFFRVDHITYLYTHSGDVFVNYGPTYGVFDHLDGTTPQNHFLTAMFYNFEAPFTTILQGETLARTGARFGTQNFIFIEDSNFNCSGSFGTGAISDSSSGIQRLVFRHNSLTGSCFHYQHWTRSNEWDGGYSEYYNNVYQCTDASCASGSYPCRFNAGTGIFHDNQITGYQTDSCLIDEARGCGAQTSAVAGECKGAPPSNSQIDVNGGDPNAPGWPCAGQVGSGCTSGTCTRSQMTSVPYIMYNNGAQAGCANGGSCTNSTTFSVDGPPGGGSCTRTMSNYLMSTPHTASGGLNGAIDYSSGAAKPSSVGIYSGIAGYTPFQYPYPTTLISGGGGTVFPTSLGPTPISFVIKKRRGAT